MSRPTRLLYLVTDAWFFESHFLHLARAALKEGYSVAVAGRFQVEELASEPQIQKVSLPIYREQQDIYRPILDAVQFFKAQKIVNADIIHAISLRQCLAAFLLSIVFWGQRFVLAPTGMGVLWLKQGFISQLLRQLIVFIFWFMKCRGASFIFENEEDADLLGLRTYRKTYIVGGAGIDPDKFFPSVEPASSPIRVAVVARMLKSKGILQSVEAIRQFAAQGIDIQLHLYGAPDYANIDSLTVAELRQLESSNVIWHGATKDIQSIWQHNHIALLLSAREGLPKSLLEAAACGRPIITTNVVGCRRLIRHEVEGLLVPYDDPQAAAQAIIELAQNQKLREQFGEAARKRILNGFTEEQVSSAILVAYAQA